MLKIKLWSKDIAHKIEEQTFGTPCSWGITNKFAALSIHLFNIQLASQLINQTLSLSVYQPSIQLASVLIIKQSVYQSISHSYS